MKIHLMSYFTAIFTLHGTLNAQIRPLAIVPVQGSSNVRPKSLDSPKTTMQFVDVRLVLIGQTSAKFYLNISNFNDLIKVDLQYDCFDFKSGFIVQHKSTRLKQLEFFIENLFPSTIYGVKFDLLLSFWRHPRRSHSQSTVFRTLGQHNHVNETRNWGYTQFTEFHSSTYDNTTRSLYVTARATTDELNMMTLADVTCQDVHIKSPAQKLGANAKQTARFYLDVSSFDLADCSTVCLHTWLLAGLAETFQTDAICVSDVKKLIKDTKNRTRTRVIGSQIRVEPSENGKKQEKSSNVFESSAFASTTSSSTSTTPSTITFTITSTETSTTQMHQTTNPEFGKSTSTFDLESSKTSSVSTLPGSQVTKIPNSGTRQLNERDSSEPEKHPNGMNLNSIDNRLNPEVRKAVVDLFDIESDQIEERKISSACFCHFQVLVMIFCVFWLVL